MIPRILFLSGLAAAAWAQEAESGFELRSTVSAESAYSHELTDEPRDGAPLIGGFQALLYPTWKLNSHWAASGTIQVHSRPYFPEEFDTQGYGVKTNILSANISYSRFWGKGSLVVRAGQLTSAFGSFLLRYDPSVNPLPGIPPGYGYYQAGVAVQGLAGAQVDATAGSVDMRAQFTNSSPANPRSVFDRDQYANWAGGAGYTIRQGFRVGVSAYRGPYLDRNFEFYFSGEAPPRDLPASGYGLDVQWGRGPWNVYGELQRFQMTYRAIPTVNLKTGYAEGRRVLTPRWFAAARIGYSRPHPYPGFDSYELGAGFRANAFQVLKFGYTLEYYPGTPGTPGTLERSAVVQFVTSFRAFGMAKN
jgi:hypothetical protein